MVKLLGCMGLLLLLAIQVVALHAMDAPVSVQVNEMVMIVVANPKTGRQTVLSWKLRVSSRTRGQTNDVMTCDSVVSVKKSNVCGRRVHQ